MAALYMPIQCQGTANQRGSELPIDNDMLSRGIVLVRAFPLYTGYSLSE